MKGHEELSKLALDAANGNKESFAALYIALKPSLYYTAKRMLSSDALAMDAVSEAFLRAYKAVSKLQNTQNIAAWFTRILINVAMDMLRRQKREVALDMIPEVSYTDAHEWLDFEALVKGLPSEQNMVIRLKYYQGCTFRDIALLLKETEGTVKGQHYRALRHLRLHAAVL